MKENKAKDSFQRLGMFHSDERYLVKGHSKHNPSYSVETVKYIPVPEGFDRSNKYQTKENFDLIPGEITTSYLSSTQMNNSHILSRSLDRNSQLYSSLEKRYCWSTNKQSDVNSDLTESKVKPSEYIKVTNQYNSCNAEFNENMIKSKAKTFDQTELISNNKNNNETLNQNNTNEKKKLIRGGVCHLSSFNENNSRMNSINLSTYLRTINNRRERDKEKESDKLSLENNQNEKALKQDSVITGKQFNKECNQKEELKVIEEKEINTLSNQSNSNNDYKEKIENYNNESHNINNKLKNNKNKETKVKNKKKKKSKGVLKGKMKKSTPQQKFTNELIPEVAYNISYIIKGNKINKEKEKKEDIVQSSEIHSKDENNKSTNKGVNNVNVIQTVSYSTEAKSKLLYDYSKYESTIINEEEPIKHAEKKTFRINEKTNSILHPKQLSVDLDEPRRFLGYEGKKHQPNSAIIQNSNKILSTTYSSLQKKLTPYDKTPSYALVDNINQLNASFQLKQSNDNNTKSNIGHYYSHQITQRNNSIEKYGSFKLNYNYQIDTNPISNINGKQSNRISLNKDSDYNVLNYPSHYVKDYKSHKGKETQLKKDKAKNTCNNNTKTKVTERDVNMRNKPNINLKRNINEGNSDIREKESNTVRFPNFLILKSHQDNHDINNIKETPVTGLFRKNIHHRKQAQSVIENNYISSQINYNDNNLKDNCEYQTEHYDNHFQTFLDDNFTFNPNKVCQGNESNNNNVYYNHVNIKDKNKLQSKSMIDSHDSNNNNSSSIKNIYLNYNYNTNSIILPNTQLTYEMINNQNQNQNQNQINNHIINNSIKINSTKHVCKIASASKCINAKPSFHPKESNNQKQQNPKPLSSSISAINTLRYINLSNTSKK